MVFEVSGKIALITGAASGIGLCHAKELLKTGAKGVTLADVNETKGEEALEEIEIEFGRNKAIFVKTDVSVKDEFENAFKKTIEQFGYIDILINNAAVVNDSDWKKEIDVNVIGTINGILLGLENYLKNYRQGDEAIILNTSSIYGTIGDPVLPIYSATKLAILGMTKSWSSNIHYNRTKVRIVAICPGWTDTSICPLVFTTSDDYLNCMEEVPEKIGINGPQRPQHVARETIKVLKFAENGSIWVIEYGEPAYQYRIPHPNKTHVIAHL